MKGIWGFWGFSAKVLSAKGSISYFNIRDACFLPFDLIVKKLELAVLCTSCVLKAQSIGVLLHSFWLLLAFTLDLFS